MKDKELEEILAKAVVGEDYISVNENGQKKIDLATKRLKSWRDKAVREARIDEWDFIWDFMQSANDTAHDYLKEITDDRIKELQDGK